MSLKSDAEIGVVDAPVPRNYDFAGRYKQSFAYYTFKTRLPATLDKLHADLIEDKSLIVQSYEGISEKELLQVIEQIDQLKTDIANNETLTPLTGDEPDIISWNHFLSELPNGQRSYFHACWLYAECYMYRKISSFFKATVTLKNYDYFGHQKEHAMRISEDVIHSIIDATRETESSQEMFSKLVKVNLWGNRCDLSISSGKEVKPGANPLEDLKQLDENVLIDNCEEIWKELNRENPLGQESVDIICDNAGFEFFTDLILAEYIIDKGFANKVRFNVKAIPWYISDVTPNDFYWSIRFLQNNEKYMNLRQFGSKMNRYVMEGKFELAPEEFFWTGPYEFHRMTAIKPSLHSRLSESKLLIFKGDLNYRKLLGDYNWDYTEVFNTCLRGFRPSSLCTLRTIKADLICGMTKQKVRELFSTHPDWMTTGEFGVIQFARNIATPLDF